MEENTGHVDATRITEHGTINTSELLRILSEILTDRYGAQVTVRVKDEN